MNLHPTECDSCNERGWGYFAEHEEKRLTQVIIERNLLPVITRPTNFIITKGGVMNPIEPEPPRPPRPPASPVFATSEHEYAQKMQAEEEYWRKLDLERQLARRQQENSFQDQLAVHLARDSRAARTDRARKRAKIRFEIPTATTTIDTLEVEREIQARMAYRVGPHPWFVGYRVVVDAAKGGCWILWRPTRRSAEATGHDILEREVRRRQRAWDARHPKAVTALDRWIIEPTAAEQNQKELQDWDDQFREAGQ